MVTENCKKIELVVVKLSSKTKCTTFSEHGVMVKVKCVLPMRRGAHLPSLGCEFVVGQTTEVCNQWPVQCQLHGYLSSHRESLSCDRCQFMVAEAHVCEQLAQDCYLSNCTANSCWQKSSG